MEPVFCGLSCSQFAGEKPSSVPNGSQRTWFWHGLEYFNHINWMSGRDPAALRAVEDPPRDSVCPFSLHSLYGSVSLVASTPLSRSTDRPPLTGKRIVTSYEVLAGEYFREVDERAGLSPDEGTRIEYISGSVEAACSLGLADGIGTVSSPTPSRRTDLT